MADETDPGPTGGAVWSKPDEWAARRTPRGCVICTFGEPLNVIAEFETCWATAAREAALPGYVCVVARRHYNEPFEMPADEQARFWQESLTIAAAVGRATRPIKMNYEIHGTPFRTFTSICFLGNPMIRTSAGQLVLGAPRSYATRRSWNG